MCRLLWKVWFWSPSPLVFLSPKSLLFRGLYYVFESTHSSGSWGARLTTFCSLLFGSFVQMIQGGPSGHVTSGCDDSLWALWSAGLLKWTMLQNCPCEFPLWKLLACDGGKMTWIRYHWSRWLKVSGRDLLGEAAPTWVRMLGTRWPCFKLLLNTVILTGFPSCPNSALCGFQDKHLEPLNLGFLACGRTAAFLILCNLPVFETWFLVMARLCFFYLGNIPQSISGHLTLMLTILLICPFLFMASATKFRSNGGEERVPRSLQ